MRRTLVTSIAVVALVLTSAASTTASASGGVKLSNVQFSLGSLIATGAVSGLGNADVTVGLDARGIAVVTCTNQGGKAAPGQNSAATASGQQLLQGSDPVRKNGKSPFGVETEDATIPPAEAGCPNDNWTAEIEFVFWTDATITVTDAATAGLLLTQSFNCVTTRNPDSVSCTPAT